MEKKYKIYLLLGTLVFTFFYMLLLLFFKVEESLVLTALSKIILVGISITLGINLIFLIPFDKNFNISSSMVKFFFQIVFLIIVGVFLFYTKIWQMELNATSVFYNFIGSVIVFIAIILSNQIVSEKFVVMEFSVLMIFRTIFMIHIGSIYVYLLRIFYQFFAR